MQEPALNLIVKSDVDKWRKRFSHFYVAVS